MPSKRSCDSSSDLRKSLFQAVPGIEAAETLFDTINDVLFCVKDRQRRYVAANDAFVKRAGLAHRSELLGRTANQIFPEILAAGYEQQDDEVFSSGTTVRDRLEMITQADGNVGWFVSQKVAVRSTDGRVVAVAGTSRDLDIPAATGGELGKLANVLYRLHRDSNQPLRIEALAVESGFSWSQFQRRVRSITGLTPRQILTKSRIESAAQKLRDTDDSLADIANSCGFYDQSAFNRQFRNAAGLTPGQYRRVFHQS